MNRIISQASLIAALLVLPMCSRSQMPQKSTDLDQRVEGLLDKMTLEDKVGEMTQLTLDMLCVGEPYNLVKPIRLDPEKMRVALVDLRVGSILNAPGQTIPLKQWREFIEAIQELAVKQKASGIPVC